MDKWHEPAIQIGGTPLTTAQAMAVRVAITLYHMEMGTEQAKKDLGDIANGYRARLGEVLALMARET